ncbi:MAG: DUF4349 domain-containing protein [Candidatus Woesearchaeota archaeon]|jgi:hypothetical protein|nr:DUF4349 domain-containing protein [Candidatus Woesearchaeota archaeon]
MVDKNENHLKKNWKNYVISIFAAMFLIPMLGVILMIGVNFTDFGGLSSMSSKSISNDMMYERSMGSSYYPSYDEGFSPEAEDRKVIKNANIQLEAEDFDKSKSQIQNSITAHEVIVLSESESKYRDDYRNVNYRFKVNSASLDVFLGEIKTYGEVQSLNVYVNDVTGSYTDYTQRVERYNNQIVTYITMLQKENISIQDEIQIQNRIDNLEDQIFYLNNRISTIDEEVAYSEVYLTVREKPSTLSEIDFLGLKDGFKLFVNSFEAGLQIMLALLGFIIVPFVVGYGVFRSIKWMRK